MQSASLILLLIPVIGISLAFQFKGNEKARDVIDQWAEQEEVTVVSKQFLFGGGKFFFSHSKSQRVYRVVVRNVAGQQRTADIRCGSWIGGMLSDNISVRWHD
jgi:hypothetical protein